MLQQLLLQLVQRAQLLRGKAAVDPLLRGADGAVQIRLGPLALFCGEEELAAVIPGAALRPDVALLPQPLDQAGEGGHRAAEGFADLCERRAPLGPVADESQDVGLHRRDLLLVQGAVDQPLRLHTDLAKAVGQPGVIDLLHRYSPP